MFLKHFTFLFLAVVLVIAGKADAASMERTSELDRICERAVSKRGYLSGQRNNSDIPSPHQWILRKVRGSGWFDRDAFLKYFYAQKTNDSFEHSVTCKIDEYKWIEVENWVDGYGMAIVCYTGGDQDGMGC